LCAADGEVWAACTPGQPNEKVAIKKITQVFSQVTEAKRILRELRILRHLDHPNLIRFARPHARRALHVAVAH
jgi:serine/threonine protein kinase